ncbi:conserved exported hypothetical protein [Sphingomonas sp. EC-HK361]|uniref:hypothetical protein n=1 Tax=Sphingomonas sp. EC-HK361 TaxID=2038397 RepID=UPI0012571564|nr:hypothetical protein [Sphingomonas sp. EC-HK361]VVT03311.1 conserved exported hypothetical protein [Sphingomonas sp. EC-HK361]
MIRMPLLAIGMLAAAPAFAQTAPAPAATPAAPATASVAAGATVFDTAGGTVGTVASVNGDVVVIDTGTHKAGVPMTSIGKGAKGPTMAMTKAQLDTAAAQQQQQAQAQLQQSLVAGAQVKSLNGTAVVGTIKSADAQFVTLTTAKGEVKLPANGFSMGPNGLIVGLTAQQFDAAVSGAAAAPVTSTPPSK